MTNQLYDSRFGKVDYIPDDQLILLTWKEKCSYDDYRNTTLAALSGLQNYPYSNLVIDARNGFEDEPEDVEWGFQVLLPAMSRTTCQTVIFIMKQINEIEEEMDMWTQEFRKYFTVLRVDSYQKAVGILISAT